MNQREVFHTIMNFEKPEIPCQFEQGYWPETITRWYGEGLAEGVEPWDAVGITHYYRWRKKHERRKACAQFTA